MQPKRPSPTKVEFVTLEGESAVRSSHSVGMCAIRFFRYFFALGAGLILVVCHVSSSRHMFLSKVAPIYRKPRCEIHLSFYRPVDLLGLELSGHIERPALVIGFRSFCLYDALPPNCRSPRIYLNNGKPRRRT